MDYCCCKTRTINVLENYPIKRLINIHINVQKLFLLTENFIVYKQISK